MLRVDIEARNKCKDYASREHSSRREDCVWCRRITAAYQRAAQLDVELRSAEQLGAELRWHGRAEFALRPAGRANAMETANTPLRLDVRICVDAACPLHPLQRYDVPPPTCATCRQLERALRRALELRGDLCVFQYLKVMALLHPESARTVPTARSRYEIN